MVSSRKPVHQNLLELTKFWLHTIKRARYRWRSRMEDGKRHEIPLRIRPVIGFNARILKIRNTLPCCWNTRRAEIFAYLCAVVDQWRRREEALVNVNKVKNRRINFVCTSSASGKKDWLLARRIFTLRTDEREREKRERGQRERPRVYRRYQRY